MPGFDRTGPMGGGAMSGWGQGLCNPAGTAGAGGARNFYGFGRGFGCRRGRGGGGRGPGFGRGYGYGSGPAASAGRPAPLSPAEERELLQNQASQLQESLERIQRRLAEMAGDEATPPAQP